MGVMTTLAPELTATFCLLTFMDLSMTLHTFGRLRQLHSVAGNHLDTQKLFVVTLLLTCLLRTLSFLGITILCVESIDVYDEDRDTDEDVIDGGAEDTDEAFYEKAVLTMFDLPDFTIVTAYLLLVIVYAETYLHARRHWLDAMSLRRRWIRLYLCGNVVLYALQLSLYSLIFVPHLAQPLVFDLIYTVQGAISFALPLLVAVLFVFLTFKFSGFPFRSLAAEKRLRRVSFVLNIWTVGRLAWGTFAVFSVLSKWSTDYSNTVYSIFLVILFLCAEIIPFLLALDAQVLSVLAILSTGAFASDAPPGRMPDFEAAVRGAAPGDLYSPLVSAAGDSDSSVGDGAPSIDEEMDAEGFRIGRSGSGGSYSDWAGPLEAR